MPARQLWQVSLFNRIETLVEVAKPTLFYFARMKWANICPLLN